MRSEQAGDNLQTDAFVEDLLKVIDTSIESPAGKVAQLKRIFQKAGVLVPDTIKPGESVNTKLSADVSVRDAVIYTWAWAPARWILGSLDTPVRLLHARHVPALKELISEFANSLRVGPHKTVLGALGWYVDGKRSHMLDAVALAVPEVGQTLDCCVYCDGGDLASRRLLIETRVDVMLDLCDALQHLRTSGLVLLDLQPTNVALGDSTRDPYTGAVISLKHAYRVGAVLTEADVRELEAVYTAPPVAAGDVVEVGMDCWALGVLLWELVMGFKPVAGVQAPVRVRGAHTDDAAASRNWIFATEAVTDTITHDTMTMLLLPSAVQRPSPAEVHHWLHSLKAQVASDMYQEMAAALADGTEMLEAADVDLGSSASLRREECAAACSAHVGEAGNDALVVEYQADRIGGTLSSLVVASPRACQEVTRAASLPQAQPRFPRWARRVGDKVKQAPVVAYAALIAVVLAAMKK